MKSASTPRKLDHRDPLHRRTKRMFVRTKARGSWLATPDFDEAGDADVRELIERVARGDMIRGHAL